MAQKSNLFQQLELEMFRKSITPRTKESIEWLRLYARQLYRGRAQKGSLIMKDERVELLNKNEVGLKMAGMYCYFYDPKHKETLPYYDGFPLIIMLGPAKGGFMGLNLHYLPPVLRAKVLDALINNQPIPQKYINPMIKHYLWKQMRSRFARIAEEDWEKATFLPTADWRKQSGAHVYRESRKKMNG